MKYFSALLMLMSMLAIGSGCCTNIRTMSPPPSAEEITTETIRSVEDMTVALVNGREGERVAYCAGVWAGDKKIITAGHCVETAGRMVAEVAPWEEYNPVGDVVMFVNHSDAKDEEVPQDKVWLGIVEKFDVKLDLAVVRPMGETSAHRIAKLIAEPINAGQSLHIVGHTVGMTWSYSRGYVANSRKIEGPSSIEMKTIQVSAPVWMGNSGGGAFDSEGHLVGICSWINTRAPNIAFFIHHDELVNFLNEPSLK